MSISDELGTGWGYTPTPRWPFCGRLLFPPPHQAMVVYGSAPFYLDTAPVQGPAPAVCLLDPHPEGTWHWDGKGTWFR